MNEDDDKPQMSAKSHKSAEVQNLDFKKSNNCNSRSMKNEHQEVQILNPNNTDNNHTDVSETDTINLSAPDHTGIDEMDITWAPKGKDEIVKSRLALIRRNILLDWHMSHEPVGARERYEEL
ncbi:MAG: hypothetical protein K6F00_04440 [Lachnospiraceae bacterium]|nr:hypothetical protein [Lachnospiraceae bacterium]